jgi:hypothetical protein
MNQPRRCAVVLRFPRQFRIVGRTVANDNRSYPMADKADDDREVAGIAARCLGMLFAPDERMFHERACERWGIAQLAMNEVFTNEQASVEQTVVALQVMASWQRYWFKFHHKSRERNRCHDAWLNTCEVLERHERRNNVDI